MKTNKKPLKERQKAEEFCLNTLGYNLGAELYIKFRENWHIKTCVIKKQVGCNHYIVRCVNTGKGFNFYPSIHAHEFLRQSD